MTNGKMKVFIDGKPASLRKIIKAAGNDKLKKYIEEHPQQHVLKTHFLEQYVGESISSIQVNALTGMDSRELTKLRVKGELRSTKLNGRWYYSVNDLIEALKKRI